MASHDPDDALAALAYYLGTVAGLTGGAHYPVPPAYPDKAALVRWRRFERPDRETWLLTADAFLVVTGGNEGQYDVAALDPLVVAAVDRFDPLAHPDAYHLERDGNRVDLCALATGERVIFDGNPAWQIEATIKLRRTA